MELLVALRVLQAAGAALLLPTSLALLLPEFPPEKRSVVVAGWAAVSGIAAAAGPPIGGLLVELSWRWVFMVNVPIGIAALLVGARVPREARDPASVRPDAWGAVLLAAGVGALVGGIVEGPEWGWGDPWVVGAFAAAAGLIAVVAWRCAHHPAPVADPALLRVRSFTTAVVAAVIFSAGFGAMLLSSVLFLTGPWSEDILQAGLGIAPGPAMAALFSVPGARLARRIGMGAVGAIGAALFIAGATWWLARLGPEPAYARAFLPGMLVGGAGVGFILPTLTGAATAALPAARFATGTAVVTMGRQIGIAIGVAVLVALLGAGRRVADFDAAYVFIIATVAVSGVALASLGRVTAPPAV